MSSAVVPVVGLNCLLAAGLVAVVFGLLWSENPHQRVWHPGYHPPSRPLNHLSVLGLVWSGWFVWLVAVVVWFVVFECGCAEWLGWLVG